MSIGQEGQSSGPSIQTRVVVRFVQKHKEHFWRWGYRVIVCHRVCKFAQKLKLKVECRLVLPYIFGDWDSVPSPSQKLMIISVAIRGARGRDLVRPVVRFVKNR